MQNIVIETVNLTRRFGKLTAVDAIDLKVPEKSIYGFLGPNGAGKTTTIRMLLGLIRPTHGEVNIFGLPFKKNRIDLLKRIRALVEKPSLYPHLTGYENLEVTRRLLGIGKDYIPKALETVKLTNDAKRLVRQYSTGMKQRLGLALALLGEPDLLILDEPFSGLDPAGIRDFRDIILSFSKEQGGTVFLSSHLLSEIQQTADYVGIVDKGKLLFQGTFDELQVQQKAQIQIEVDNPEKAVELLSSKGWTVQSTEENRIFISVGESQDSSEINSFLVQNGLKVISINVKEASLEDLFLKLTEKSDLS